MSADVCCQCVARGIPWQSTARQLSAQQIAPADASMPIESLELDLQSTPVLGSSFQAHGSAIPGHPGPSRAIPGHPVVTVVFFHVKDGEEP